MCGVRKRGWERKTAVRETDTRWMDRHTNPSDEWTDGQTDRQISWRDVIIDTNMDYTLQCYNSLFFISIKDMNLFMDE